MKPIEALKKYWGYDSFRPFQAEIIDRVISLGDTVALLPTGGGKSLTYQVPAVLMDGVTIVITPLIALMTDQVQALKKRGIQAVAINSSMSYREIDVALDNCVYGDIKLLYIAPERIDTPIFRARLLRMNVSLLAVDEAHCISQWGYDFRPSYFKIDLIRQLLPEVPILAVTATATSIVLDDIVKYLKLSNHKVFRASFARDNLSFVVRCGENKLEQLLRVADKVDGSGIVYVRTRNDAQQVSEFLTSRGVSSDYYHAGLGFKLRNQKQGLWMSGKVRVIVATNAFGMGIDKSDVRFVVHHQIPDSIEAYYQEAGRAGRDGARSWAVLLYTDYDAVSAQRRIAGEYPSVETIRTVYESLFNYLQIAIGGGRDVVTEFNVRDFALKFKIFSLTAYNALKILELNGYLVLTDTLDNPTRIMMRVDRNELYRTQVGQPQTEGVLKVLLRNYTGLFSQFVPIDEEYMARVSGYTVSHIIERLLELSRLKIIRLIPKRTTPMLILNGERLPTSDVLIHPSTHATRRTQSELRSLAMVDYASEVDVCRSMMLCNYFDQLDVEPCGVCDVCIDRRKRGLPLKKSGVLDASIDGKVLEILKNGSTTHSLHSLVALLGHDTVSVLTSIRSLLARGAIKQSENGEIVTA